MKLLLLLLTVCLGLFVFTADARPYYYGPSCRNVPVVPVPSCRNYNVVPHHWNYNPSCRNYNVVPRYYNVVPHCRTYSVPSYGTSFRFYYYQSPSLSIRGYNCPR